MATIAYSEPLTIQPAGSIEPDLLPFPVTLPVLRGDFVVLTSGNAVRAGANVATGFIGMAAQDGNTTFGLPPGSPVQTRLTANTAIFGYGTYNTPLQPNVDVSQLRVIAAHNQQGFVMNLSQAVTWATTLIGTTAGLNYDATSGFFFVDTGLANKVCTIIASADGPDRGTVGDLGKRVIVTFLPAALAV